MALKYNKSRFPVQPAKGTCRGCHGPVPNGRQTWCSEACIQRYHPHYVIQAVKERDKWVCQLCGRNIKEMFDEWERTTPSTFFQRYPFPMSNPLFTGKTYWDSIEWKTVQAEHEAHRKLRPRAEYDHIIPFSEGGKTILENMRTLCSTCHKQRTKEWRRERKQSIQQQQLMYDQKTTT